VLFPSHFSNGALSIAAPLPPHWKLGMDLWLRGPLGKGFAMPAIARRVALAGMDGAPARLLPLAYQALAQRAAVALYTADVPAGLPAEVEILPLELLPEAPQWADFLAVDIAQSELPHLRSRLGLAPYQHLVCTAQVLVVAPMPCCGLAECGVCAVRTRDKWAAACADGPVFDFQQLELAG
jgi:NAD(P)H-flavin reductase